MSKEILISSYSELNEFIKTHRLNDFSDTIITIREMLANITGFPKDARYIADNAVIKIDHGDFFIDAKNDSHIYAGQTSGTISLHDTSSCYTQQNSHTLIYAYDKSEVKSACDDFIAAFDNSNVLVVGNAYVHSVEGVNVERSELHDVFATKLESYSDVNYKREFVTSPVDSEHRVSQRLVIEKQVAVQRDKEFYQDHSLDINDDASVIAQFRKAVTFNRYQCERGGNYDERIQITASRNGQVHIYPKATAVNYQLARDFVSVNSSVEDVIAKVSMLHMEALEKNTTREHSEVTETKTQSAKSAEETHRSASKVEQQKNRKQHTR